MPIREDAVRANFAQGGKHPRVREVETRATRDTCELQCAMGAKPAKRSISHEVSRNKEKHRGLRTLPPLNVFAALENTRVCGTLREVRIRRGCLD